MNLQFHEESHTYLLDGVDVPSVTQIIRGAGLMSLVDWSDRERELMIQLGFSQASLVPTTILENALARGRRVHKAAHFLSEGDLDWSTVADVDRPYVEAAVRYLEDSRFELLRTDEGEPLGREVRLASTRYQYAGTADLVGRLHGRWCIGDWKTGDPEDVAADIQLSAYENALREMQIIPGLKPLDPILRVSIKLQRNGRYVPMPYDGPKHTRDFSYFLAALSLHHYRGNLRRKVMAA